MELIKGKFMKENTVIHARTKKEAEFLCSWARSNNYKIGGEYNYYDAICYKGYKEDVCFNFYSLTYKSLSHYVSEKYNIITLDDITEPFFGSNKESKVNKQTHVSDTSFIYFLCILNLLFVNYLIWFR